MRQLTAIMAGASTAMLLSAPLHAQSLPFDAEVSFYYIHAPDDSFDYQLQLEGSAEFDVAPQFSVQVDLAYIKYDGSDPYGYAGVRGIYAATPDLAFGLGYSMWLDESDETYLTLDLLYDPGPFAVEAFYSRADYSGSMYDYFGIEGTYRFGQVGSLPGDIEVFAGYVGEYQDGDRDNDNPYIGVRAGLGNGFDVMLRYADMSDGDYRYITLGVTKTFGEGTTFGRRDYFAFFPGY